MAATVKGHQFKLEVNTGTVDVPAYAALCVSAIDVALNEVLEDWTTICDEGFARSEVTGMAPELSLTFKNQTGDTDISAAGIIFLYEKFWDINARNDVQFQLTDPATQTLISFNATISTMSYAVEPQALQEISASIKIVGKPTITPVTAPPANPKK